MINTPDLNAMLQAIQRLDATASDTDVSDDATWNEILHDAHEHVRDVATPFAQFLQGIAGYAIPFGIYVSDATPRATVLAFVRGILGNLSTDETLTLVEGIRADLVMRDRLYIPTERACPWCRNPAQPRTEPNPEDVPF